MKKGFSGIAVTLLILSIAAAMVYYAYFLPNNTVVPAFEEGKLNLVVEGEVDSSKNGPKVVNGEILLPIETVKKYFDSAIYWDETAKKVTITTDKKVIRMKTDSLEAMINNKPMTLKLPVTVDNNIVYIPIEFLSDLYNIEINHLKDKNVIIIDYTTKVKQMADVVKPINANVAVRKTQSLRAPILKKFDPASEKPEETVLRVFETYENWYKVRTAEGTIGYIEKKYVVLKDLVVKKLPREEPVNTGWKPEKGKINLVWEMIWSRQDYSKREKMDGVDVVSPTWFYLQDETGKVGNNGDPKYMEWARSNNYKVWPLLKNDNLSADTTKKFLNNTDARDNLIRQILAYAALYKVDGINIDFENIYVSDKDALTQFTREITPLLKEQGLVVSIDIGVPDGSENWSLCYDRKALGQIVDYVAVMTYDQFWTGAPTAGSVAQLSWVEKYLKKTLETVPKEKLLLGIPSYTRIWEEKPDKDGKIKVTSKTVNMGAAIKNAKDNNANVVWDEISGQFYAEYKKDTSTFKIWMEDDNSIGLKSALVQKYNIAGAAVWSRNDADKSIWGVLNKNLKQYASYEEWQAENKDKKYVFN